MSQSKSGASHKLITPINIVATYVFGSILMTLGVVLL